MPGVHPDVVELRLGPERLRQALERLLDRRTVETEGLDVATKDFVAGMTDRYAVNLYEQLFIPKPWVSMTP